MAHMCSYKSYKCSLPQYSKVLGSRVFLAFVVVSCCFIHHFLFNHVQTRTFKRLVLTC